MRRCEHPQFGPIGVSILPSQRTLGPFRPQGSDDTCRRRAMGARESGGRKRGAPPATAVRHQAGIRPRWRSETKPPRGDHEVVEHADVAASARAAASCRVSATSSSLGEGSPDGCVCQRITAWALSAIAPGTPRRAPRRRACARRGGARARARAGAGCRGSGSRTPPPARRRGAGRGTRPPAPGRSRSERASQPAARASRRPSSSAAATTVALAGPTPAAGAAR